MTDVLAAQRLNMSLAAKIKAEAKRRDVIPDYVRKQYVFTLFLSRMFSGEERPPWILLGGNALMIRAGGGRFTLDIDLARRTVWNDLDGVKDELQTLADQSPDRDPFRFEVYAIEARSEADPFGYGVQTAKARVRAYLGAAQFDEFSVDITTGRHPDGGIDDIPLKAIIAHETLDNLPSVPTTPAENHLADKICAMYELHGGKKSPSTRYRDLADIVRLIGVADIDASRLQEVLAREKGRRKMELPTALVAPDEEWVRQFPVAARNFAEYPRHLWPLDASLEAAAVCVGPILSGERTTGVWTSRTGTWFDA